MSSNLGVSALEAKIEQYLKAIVPIGTVVAFAGAVVPAGWLLCGGGPVSIAAYPELSAAIGTAHGNGTQNADGSASGFSGTHFNLPDYRGRFLRGVDGVAGNDPDKLSRAASKTGGNTANNVGSIQSHANESHTHIQDAHTHIQNVHAHAIISRSTINLAGGGTATVATSFTNGASMNSNDTTATNQNATATNQNSGGNESRPKNANVNYIIRAV